MNGQGGVEKVTDQTEHDQISANLTQVNENIQKLINDISVLADYMYGAVDPSPTSEKASEAPSPGIMGRVSDDLLVALTLLREANEAFGRLRR